MIHTIFFDADGTLLDFKKAEIQALKALKEDMNTPLDLDDFISAYHSINDKIWIELEEGLISPEELKLERFKRFAFLLNSPLAPDDLSQRYLNYLGRGCFLIKGADTLLEKLKGRYRMALITNGLTIVQEARFKTLNYDQYFEEILISEKEKSAKPAPRLFELAAERMGIQLDSTVLMVGDSLTSDIAGGINAGIQTCWYNPGKWNNESEFIADYEIHSLSELEQVLDTGH